MDRAARQNHMLPQPASTQDPHQMLYKAGWHEGVEHERKRIRARVEAMRPPEIIDWGHETEAMMVDAVLKVVDTDE